MENAPAQWQLRASTILCLWRQRFAFLCFRQLSSTQERRMKGVMTVQMRTRPARRERTTEVVGDCSSLFSSDWSGDL